MESYKNSIPTHSILKQLLRDATQKKSVQFAKDDLMQDKKMDIEKSLQKKLSDQDVSLALVERYYKRLYNFFENNREDKVSRNSVENKRYLDSLLLDGMDLLRNSFIEKDPVSFNILYAMATDIEHELNHSLINFSFSTIRVNLKTQNQFDAWIEAAKKFSQPIVLFYEVYAQWINLYDNLNSTSSSVQKLEEHYDRLVEIVGQFPNQPIDLTYLPIYQTKINRVNECENQLAIEIEYLKQLKSVQQPRQDLEAISDSDSDSDLEEDESPRSTSPTNRIIC